MNKVIKKAKRISDKILYVYTNNDDSIWLDIKIRIPILVEYSLSSLVINTTEIKEINKCKII